MSSAAGMSHSNHQTETLPLPTSLQTSSPSAIASLVYNDHASSPQAKRS